MLRGKKYSIVGVTLNTTFEELGDMVEELNKPNLDMPYHMPYIAKIRRSKNNGKSIEILVATANTKQNLEDNAPINADKFVLFGYIGQSSAAHIRDEDIDENDIYIIQTKLNDRKQLHGKSYLWFSIARPDTEFED